MSTILVYIDDGLVANIPVLKESVNVGRVKDLANNIGSLHVAPGGSWSILIKRIDGSFPPPEVQGTSTMYDRYFLRGGAIVMIRDPDRLLAQFQ